MYGSSLEPCEKDVQEAAVNSTRTALLLMFQVGPGNLLQKAAPFLPLLLPELQFQGKLNTFCFRGFSIQTRSTRVSLEGRRATTRTCELYGHSNSYTLWPCGKRERERRVTLLHPLIYQSLFGTKTNRPTCWTACNIRVIINCGKTEAPHKTRHKSAGGEIPLFPTPSPWVRVCTILALDGQRSAPSFQDSQVLKSVDK